MVIISMLCVAVATWLTSQYGPIRRVMMNSIVVDEKSHLKNGYKKMSLSEHVFAVFAIVCLQRKKFRFDTVCKMILFHRTIVIAAKDSSTRSPNSSPLVGSVWCLSSIVLVYLYTSVLISYLTIPKMRPIVETTEDLAASTRLEVAAIKNSIFESTLLVF